MVIFTYIIYVFPYNVFLYIPVGCKNCKKINDAFSLCAEIFFCVVLFSEMPLSPA